MISAHPEPPFGTSVMSTPVSMVVVIVVLLPSVNVLVKTSVLVVIEMLPE